MEICNEFSIETSIAEYQIDKLREQKLLSRGPLVLNKPITYRINKNGREFIIES